MNKEIKPKFSIGQTIVYPPNGNIFHITRIVGTLYISDEGATLSFSRQDGWKLSKEKNDDIDLVITWFEHIAQLADDRKALTGEVMTLQHTLDEINRLARQSAEYVKKYIL